MCSIQSQYKGAAFGRHHKGGRAAFGRAATFVVSFVLALNRAHVLAVSTTHVLRLSKVEVLALNKAHVLRLNSDCRSSLACRSLARSLGRSLGRSVARSLGRSLARSLARSLHRSLARSIARSLDRSLAHRHVLSSKPIQRGGLRPPPQRGPRGLRLRGLLCGFLCIGFEESTCQ